MVWRLETDSDFTDFFFPKKEDKDFFEDILNNYIEESKPVLTIWRSVLMQRGEPKKQGDFFEIDNSGLISISQRALDLLRDFLITNDVELLPIQTDAGNYYALNVLNVVDCLNISESEFESTAKGKIVSYTRLEFDGKKIAENYFFKVPQIPYQLFVNGTVQSMIELERLKGLFFDWESNLVWYPE